MKKKRRRKKDKGKVTTKENTRRNIRRGIKIRNKNRKTINCHEGQMVTAGEHEVALRCKLLTEANSIKTGMEMRGSDLTKNNLKRGTRRGKKERKKKK